MSPVDSLANLEGPKLSGVMGQPRRVDLSLGFIDRR